MSLVSSNNGYTSGSEVSASLFYHYRHPLQHPAYGSPPEQSYYLGSAWSESPNSSARSVSPCDEYQPPLSSSSDYITPSLQDLSVHHQQQQQHPAPPVQTFVRVTKRRNTANKKERRRTQSINNAFADLRDCIPNVPSDTKLSKIKTLRLATSYIAYLMGVLADEDAAGGGFRADILPKRSSSLTCATRHATHIVQPVHNVNSHHAEEHAVMEHNRRCSELVS